MVRNKAIKTIKNNKGIATVLVALLMFLLVFMVGIGVDIGYMYVVKGQLQNAADAGALAGAKELDETETTLQMQARLAAQKFVGCNKAAGEGIQCDLNTNNDKNGDICVGYWNGNTFTEILPSGQIANAVKVVTRRTSEQGTGISSNNKPITLFFSKIFDWTQMSTRAEAIAWKPIRPTIPIPLCANTVSLAIPTTLYFKKQDAPDDMHVITISNFAPYGVGNPPQNTPYGPNSLVADYILQKQLAPDVCGKLIYSNTAGSQQIMNVIATAFNKFKTTDPLSPGVDSWEVIVPVGYINDPSGNPTCNPEVGAQGVQKPFLVTQYVRVRITAVNGNPTPSLVINYLAPVGCNPSQTTLGNSAVLAK